MEARRERPFTAKHALQPLRVPTPVLRPHLPGLQTVFLQEHSRRPHARPHGGRVGGAGEDRLAAEFAAVCGPDHEPTCGTRPAHTTAPAGGASGQHAEPVGARRRVAFPARSRISDGRTRPERRAGRMSVPVRSDILTEVPSNATIRTVPTGPSAQQDPGRPFILPRSCWKA